MDGQESAGTRLGRALAGEPELTHPAPAGFSDLFAAFIGQDGLTCGAVLRRLEILKCETIVNGETFSEALDRLSSQA